MHGLICDRCDEPLLLDEDVRYILTVGGHAAYDPLELTRESLEQGGPETYEKLLKQLESMTTEEIERQVQFHRTYDLCAKCWRAVCEDPLGKRRG